MVDSVGADQEEVVSLGAQTNNQESGVGLKNGDHIALNGEVRPAVPNLPFGDPDLTSKRGFLSGL